MDLGDGIAAMGREVLRASHATPLSTGCTIGFAPIGLILGVVVGGGLGLLGGQAYTELASIPGFEGYSGLVVAVRSRLATVCTQSIVVRRLLRILYRLEVFYQPIDPLLDRGSCLFCSIDRYTGAYRLANKHISPNRHVTGPVGGRHVEPFDGFENQKLGEGSSMPQSNSREIGRWCFQGRSGRSVPSCSGTMARCAMSLKIFGSGCQVTCCFGVGS